MTDAHPPVRYGTRRRPARRLAAVALAVVLVAAAGVGAWQLLRDRGPGGTPAERRAASDAVVALARLVVARPVPSSSRLCRSVGPATQEALDGLAAYLPRPSRRCEDLPRRTLRTALEPLDRTTGLPLVADVDGSSATVSLDDGREVSRATRASGGWIADPGAGGPGAWRLETSQRCSAALTEARLAPLSTVSSRYRRSISTRLAGVQRVLEMLEPSRVPDGLERTVAPVRQSLAQLRDGLRQGSEASSGSRLVRSAPDASELPSLLQLVQAYPRLRDAGVPCLGGASLSASTLDAGNNACKAARPGLDAAYRDAGRATDTAAVATAFDGLGTTWSSLATRIGALRLDGAQRLRPVRGESQRSAYRTAELSRLVATRLRTGGDDDAAAARLTLAQQDAVDGLIALGFRWCGAVAS